MKVLITGANGFVGQRLVKHIQETENNWELALAVNGVPVKFEGNHQVYDLDLCDSLSITNLLKEFVPDTILHLASLAHVPLSFKDPVKTFDINLKGTIELVNQCYQINPNMNFINISSGDVYGESFNYVDRVDEDTLLRPMNPYAVSKASVDLYLQQFQRKTKFKSIILRPFNHVGAGQTPNYVLSSFGQQIAQIEKKQIENQILVGDLTGYRDFLNVVDVLDAYIQVIENVDNINSGEIYNICSGESVSVQACLDQLIDISGLKINIKTDKDRLRPTDIKKVSGNPNKFKDAFSWQPKISFETTLLEILNFWRQKT
jgi:GDP-4-dehydro-6-deoxy-D-mannose reductase